MNITNAQELQAFLALSEKERGELDNITLRLNFLDLSDLTGSSRANLQSICTALSQCKALETIDLRYSDIYTLEEVTQFQMLWGAILQGKPLLRTIGLTQNSLGELDPTRFQIFSTALSRCKALHTIDLTYNELEQLDTARLQVLNKAFLQCKALHTISLRRNNFDPLDTDKFEALYSSLEKCETLCNVILGSTKLNPNQIARIDKMLERHKAFVAKDPEWLFYDSDKPIIQFTTNDTGDPELERLIDGYHNIYRTAKPEGTQRRTLILEDFTAKQWSAEKKSEVKQKLLSLLSQGSNIYIYQPSKPSERTQSPLLKLSTQNIDLLDSPEFEIPLIKKQVITDLMRKSLNIPAKAIAHLDTVYLKELLGDNVPGVTIQELAYSGYPLGTLKAYLETEELETPIFNTLHDNIPEHNEYCLKILKELQPFFTITTRLVNITFYSRSKDKNDHDLHNLLQQNGSTLKNLKLSEESLDSISASYIENLHDLSLNKTKIDYHTLISILKRNHHLKTLSLEVNPDSTYSEPSLTTPPALKELENLRMSTTVKKDLRDSILASSENLKILTLDGDWSTKTTSEGTLSANDISKHKLQKLEELTLRGWLAIESKEFYAILENAIHLKKLWLIFNDNFQHKLQPEDIPPGSLANLEELRVYIAEIDERTLAAMFEKTVKLKSLIIHGDEKNPFAINAMPDNILKNLENAEFFRISLNPNEVPVLLKKMTNLRELRLVWNEDGTLSKLEPKHFPPEILKNLTRCKIDYKKVSLSVCKHILKHTRQLTEEAVEPINKAIKDKITERTKKMALAEQQTFERNKKHLEPKQKNLEEPTLRTDEARTKAGTETETKAEAEAETANDETLFDADTSNETKKEFNVRQIFKGINCSDPSDVLYRLKIYDEVTITENPDKPFSLKNSSPETLTLCAPPIQHFDPGFEIKQEAEFKYYRGKTPITISHKTWIPIPSLSSREMLTHLRLTTPDGELNNNDYEIQYSSKNNLYYIRSTKPGTYLRADIEFLLKKPVEPAAAEIPVEIKALAEKYIAYGVGEGKLVLPPNPTGQDVLKALQDQKPGVGACRHRSVAFKKEVESRFKSEFPVRIITNASHVFVEVQAKSGTWVRYNLGGHPADALLFDENAKLIPEPATIDEADSTAEAAVKTETPSATRNQSEVKVALESTVVHEIANKETKKGKVDLVIPEIISEQDLEGNPLQTWEAHTKIAPKNDLDSYLLDIAQGTSPVTNSSLIKGDPLKKILVKLDSEEGTEAFRLLIQKQMLSLGKQVYYIHSPEDLICSAPWTERNLQTNTGVLRPATFPPGDKLRKFLNTKHPNPALVVNWSNFKAEDIVKFNSLLDKKRKADGVDIPDNTLIVGLYSKKPGAYNGADFFSRSDAVITFPFNDDELIAKATDLEESRHAPIQSTVTTEALEQKTEQKERIIIDLYESPNWKSILLGKWCLQGKNLVFEQGSLETALSDALKTGKEIEFKNAPWTLEEFKVFWQQARLHKKIEAYGKTIKIPDNFKVHTSEGYQWQALLENVTWHPTHEKPISVAQQPAGSELYILNPTTFNQYFKNYQSIAGDQIALKPGWIENAALEKLKNLSLLLTRELSQHQWGQLLASAQKHQIKLNIRVAPGVSLPTRFPEAVKEALAEKPLIIHTAALEEEKLDAEKGHVLMTEDIDYAIATLKDLYPKNKHPSLKNIKIIDISECEARHLLVSKTPIFNKKTLNYKFIQKISPVWTALEKGETVVLKGHFKQDLVDALAPLCSDDPHFWLNGKRLTFPGKLILITDNQAETQKCFSFASPIALPYAKADAELFALLQRDAEKRYLPTFSPEKIASAVAATKTVFEKLSKDSDTEKCTFVKLQSMVEHQLCYPNTNPDDNWQGLQSLKESAETAELELFFNAKTADEESNAFEQKRLNQINDALTHRPFVFIAGITGAGKSTFIKKTLSMHPDYKTFFENQLQTWAADKTPNVNKTLFIDEANIDKGNFSAFEGLFETPPRILIGNTYYELTPQHKVIFAGNPLSYGSRQMPTLFARRGGSVIFDRLSPAYLYSQVLKPILTNRLTEEDQETVGKKLLQAYQNISRLPSERILISPRELQMMALLVIKKHQETPQPPVEACIAYAVHMIGTGIVPENHKADFNRWSIANGFEKPTLPVPPPPFVQPGTEQSTAFVVTKSRNPAYNQIMDFLSIRALKQENTANDTLKYAGLGGMVLEGEPGVGKSHFVVDTLVSQGFTEAHWKPSDTESTEPAAQWHQNAAGQWLKQKTASQQWHKDAQEQWAPLKALPQKIFYIMPVSMQPEEKKKLLLKAFNEGAVVVIDEINSCPMMENLLNDLLMGIHEDKRPTHPGFMVIGTQNPISMEGRIAASTALERRLFKVIFPPYDSLEMKEILQNKGLDLADRERFAEQYRKARQYAIQNNKNPMPTFRDLLKIAELKIEVLREKTVAKTKHDEPSEAQLRWLLNKQKKAAADPKDGGKTPKP